ncbi:MAG: hypothetical protein KKA60_01010 [Proteobacteria bacterium]|nr:hypothetical protein [Pseudomonadota bacterium]
MASSRKYPDAFVVHTYGGASRAYTSLSSWEADTDLADLAAVTTVDADSSGTSLYVADTSVFGDCEFSRSTIMVSGQLLTLEGVNAGVSLTVSAISGTISSGAAVACGFLLELYNDNSPYNDRISLSGAGATSSYFRVLAPASGHGHDGTPATGVKVDFSGLQLNHYQGTFELLENHARVHDLVANLSGQDSAYYPGVFTLQATGNRIAGCLSCGSRNAGAGGIVGCKSTPAMDGVAVNCVFADMEYGVVLAGSGYTFSCYDVTVEGCSAIGFWRASTSTAIAKNCLAENCAANWSGTWLNWSAYHNTNDAGVTFVNAATYDFHLAETDTAARNLGLNLSGDAVFAFDDDLDGRLRNPAGWDMGADEAVLSASVADALAGGDSPFTPTEILVSVLEGLGASDAPAGAAVLLSLVDEGLSAGGAAGPGARFSVLVTEGVSTADALAVGRILLALAREGILAGEVGFLGATGLIRVSFSPLSVTVTLVSGALGVDFTPLAPGVALVGRPEG